MNSERKEETQLTRTDIGGAVPHNNGILIKSFLAPKMISLSYKRRTSRMAKSSANDQFYFQRTNRRRVKASQNDELGYSLVATVSTDEVK